MYYLLARYVLRRRLGTRLLRHRPRVLDRSCTELHPLDRLGPLPTHIDCSLAKLEALCLAAGRHSEPRFADSVLQRRVLPDLLCHERSSLTPSAMVYRAGT